MSQPDIWQIMSQIPQPEQPFITVFNDLGRVELSGRTLINGVSKAANAFRDIFETEPGHIVRIDLGWTWQQSVWQGAALIAGLSLAVDDDAVVDLVISPSVISTHPLGLPSGEPHDMTGEVLSQPDAWLYPEYFPEQVALIELTRTWAQEHGISTGDRIGIDTSASPPQAIDFLPLLVPLIIQGSVVVIDQPVADIAHISEQEKITVLLKR